MHTVFLALGSNIGDKKLQMDQAMISLKKQITNMQHANLYETKPMYYEKQATFLNTVIEGQTLLSPQELLMFIKLVEKELGRQESFRNGPREIDIDILFYDDLVYENDDLIIPHPRISERAFVLQPFSDLDPDFVHPVLHKTIKELLMNLKKKK